VLQLDDDVAVLRLVIGGGLSPSSSVGSTSTPLQSASAVAQVVRVLASLSELLSHPQAQEPLCRLGAPASPSSPLANRLLDDFLRLADAHGSFCKCLVALAVLQAEMCAALHRGDHVGTNLVR
jgi:hypothetical protein